MRIRDHRPDDEPEINLVPLIDVILVLIIFFVVTTTFDSRAVLRLQLPRADGEQVLRTGHGAGAAEKGEAHGVGHGFTLAHEGFVGKRLRAPATALAWAGFRPTPSRP